MLTPDYVDHTFRRKNDENIIGIAYDTVAPVYTDHNKCNIITISGADNMGRTNFIKYFALQMLNSEIDTHIYIADDFRRKLSDIGQENVSYDLDPDEFIQKIIMIEVLLEEKYKRLIHQENPEKRKHPDHNKQTGGYIQRYQIARMLLMLLKILWANIRY